MNKTPYARFNNKDLILRDELAIDRTLLANERTLLSYLRAGVSLIIAGISIVHFSERQWFMILGIACIPVGIITGIIGTIRYHLMNNSIAVVRNQVQAETKENPEK